MKHFLAGIVLLVFLGCSQQENKLLNVNIVDSLEFECVFPLFTWYNSGVYYNTDLVDFKINFYHDGEIKNTIGGYGEGPGEFNDIPIVGVTDTKLFILTLLPDKFSVFHKDGEFIKSAKISSEELIVSFNDIFVLGEKVTVSYIIINSDGKSMSCLGNLNMDGSMEKFFESSISETTQDFLHRYFCIIDNQFAYCTYDNIKFVSSDENLSLADLPLKKISSEYKDYIKNLESYQSDSSNIPIFFPKFKQAFDFNGKSYLQTQEQFYQAALNKGNNVYEIDLINKEFHEVTFPEELDLSKSILTSDKIFTILDSDNEKIIEYRVD